MRMKKPKKIFVNEMALWSSMVMQVNAGKGKPWLPRYRIDKVSLLHVFYHWSIDICVFSAGGGEGGGGQAELQEMFNAMHLTKATTMNSIKLSSHYVVCHTIRRCD